MLLIWSPASHQPAAAVTKAATGKNTTLKPRSPWRKLSPTGKDGSGSPHVAMTVTVATTDNAERPKKTRPSTPVRISSQFVLPPTPVGYRVVRWVISKTFPSGSRK